MTSIELNDREMNEVYRARMQLKISGLGVKVATFIQRPTLEHINDAHEKAEQIVAVMLAWQIAFARQPGEEGTRR